MNWDRVRRWDQVRAGMSDAELADERDERWFREEHERGERRGEALPAVNSAASSPARSSTSNRQVTATTSTKSQKRAALANKIGVSSSELSAARRALDDARTGLKGLTRAERELKATSRLGITRAELQILDRGLSGSVEDPVVRLRVLIQNLADMGRGASRDTSKIAPKGPPARPQARQRAVSGSTLGPATPVFVTAWGNVVHLDLDCPSARGFRHTAEPDPPTYQVPANHPCCRGRRTCRTCGDSPGHLARERMDRVLVSLHGQPFDESEWARQGWHRPLPPGEPVNGRPRPKGASSKAMPRNGPAGERRSAAKQAGSTTHQHRWSAWQSEPSGRMRVRHCYECGRSERQLVFGHANRPYR